MTNEERDDLRNKDRQRLKVIYDSILEEELTRLESNRDIESELKRLKMGEYKVKSYTARPRKYLGEYESKEDTLRLGKIRTQRSEDRVKEMEEFRRWKKLRESERNPTRRRR